MYNRDDGYRDQYGFGRNQREGVNLYWCFGPDKQNNRDSHAIACTFITTTGALPCSCDEDRARFTDWWYKWRYWTITHHKAHSNTTFPIPWPIDGPDGEPWIQGKDFD